MAWRPAPLVLDAHAAGWLKAVDRVHAHRFLALIQTGQLGGMWVLKTIA